MDSLHNSAIIFNCLKDDTIDSHTKPLQYRPCLHCNDFGHASHFKWPKSEAGRLLYGNFGTEITYLCIVTTCYPVCKKNKEKC